MAKKSLYDPHPSIRLVQHWIASLKTKTGRSLEEWVELTCREGPATEAQRREWLKTEFGHGTNSSWWIAARSLGKSTEDNDPERYLAAAAGYVSAMYEGGKAGLRPIHDRLMTLGRSIGRELKICPCETIVPFYREHVIAQIKPSTNARIDFGLALKGAKGRMPKRLVDTGGLAKKDRITHRIVLTAPEEVDDEVRAWLQVAYDLDGPKRPAPALAGQSAVRGKTRAARVRP